MLHVTLINPSPCSDSRGLNETSVWPPIGLATMAAVLERHGFQVAIFDDNLERRGAAALTDSIPAHCSCVGISVNSFTYNTTLEICTLLRSKRPDLPIILGGPLPSAAPEATASGFPCAGVIQGEGEYALLNLMRNIAHERPLFDTVQGACWRDPETGTMRKNPVERITNLDDLPFPAYHLLPPFKRYKCRSRKRPTAPLMTSRGCVFGCSFCSKDVFQRRVTFRSAQNVLEEIDLLVSRYNVRQLDILDDNFAINKPRMEEILDGIILRGYGLAINLNVGIRSEGLTEALFGKMKRAGVFKVAFGIESADDTVRQLCSKELDISNIERAISLARRHGMLVYGFFIIGLPGETEHAFDETLAFARRTRLDIANFCLAIPFVGTELYRQVERDGRFLVDTTRDLNTGFFSGQAFFEYPGFTKEDVERRYRRAYKEFYTVGKQIQHILKMRSFSEFIWFIETGFTVLKNMVLNRQKQ